MLRCFLRSKIHRATITESNLTYEGSITIDTELIEMADMKPYEQVMISNLNNGERFETYVIPGKRGSREICLNGPTARKGLVGDTIIIFAYCHLNDAEIADFKPTVIKVDSKNNPLEHTNHIVPTSGKGN
ncbi:MAG: aspartate 1-decarboxylase [Nitrospirae bacterium]|nr:aspartate 1-decarboxylase [Nitrospirota bacterium]